MFVALSSSVVETRSPSSAPATASDFIFLLPKVVGFIGSDFVLFQDGVITT